MRVWRPPDDWPRVTTIDAHTAGEPLRIVTGGVPEPVGKTMLAKRKSAMRDMEAWRRVLMWEPRGHADMYGCVLTEPVTDDGDVGALFLHNDGFSTMCGHGIVALVTVGVATGRFAAEGPECVVRIDTPAGRVTAVAELGESGVDRVRFENVPSFVVAPAMAIELPDVGEVTCDIAFGGAFYAYVDAASFDLELVPAEVDRIVDLGRRIKAAVSKQPHHLTALRHPTGESGLDFLYGTIFVGPAHAAQAHSRNVCVFADGEVDRSPTGTGVSGRLAIHHARGDIDLGEEIVVESILGTRFTGLVSAETAVGDIAAVIPEVAGRAWITGTHEFVVDPADPLGAGFLVR